MLQRRATPHNQKNVPMALAKHKSVSVSNVAKNRAKIDRRVVRTRQQIDAAFVELLHRRAYGSIRVSDITKKAGVGRATFYAHYSSKDELLRSQFSRIVAPMLAIKHENSCPLDATAFLAHVQSAPRIYKALMGPAAGGAPRILRECFEQRADQSLGLREENAQAVRPGSELRRAVTARFVASSLFAVIECFVETAAGESPQKLQSIFGDLVGGGLGTFGK
jgi:AcrR family transcriptional regulator